MIVNNSWNTSKTYVSPILNNKTLQSQIKNRLCLSQCGKVLFELYLKCFGCVQSNLFSSFFVFLACHSLVLDGIV